MIKTALKQALRSDHRWAFHGVVLLRGGAVMAVGHNQGERHAEINAISKIWPNKRKGLRVVSIRVTPGGRLAQAKPCPNCQRALRASGIKKVLYSDDNGVMQQLRL